MAGPQSEIRKTDGLVRVIFVARQFTNSMFMTTKQIYATIEKAINEGVEVILTVKHGLGDSIPDTAFEAYILGNDTYQYGFVWGRLTHQGLYYKLLLDNITAAKATSTKHAVRDDACYQHAIEEEHYARLQGFDNIYVQAARHAGK